MSVDDDVAKYANEVSTDTYTVTWKELLGNFKEEELIIDPEYQRLFRWNLDQQTQYLESILLNIPSPPLFLAQNQNSKFEVIDGLQRVSTLLKFFAAEIFPDGKLEALDTKSDLDPNPDDNDVKIPTRLAGGPIVASLEGFTALTLPETLVRAIKHARISIILLEKESSVKARYEVFRRLNKLGSPLSDQEIRNCTARLLGKEFPAQLRQLAENPYIRRALSLNEEAELRMGVEEMLLRLLTFNFSEKQLKHKITEYLDDFMSHAAEGKFNLTQEIKEQILQTFTLIDSAFPHGEAFRFPNGFSTNLFDVVATGVFFNVKTLNPEAIRERQKELLNSEKLQKVIGSGSNTRKKLRERLALGKEWFAK